MRKLSKREIRLLALLGVVALVVLWQFPPGGGGDAADAAAGQAAGKRGKLGEVPEVDLSPLDASLTEYDRDGRNLFDYSKRPPWPLEEWKRAQTQRATQERADEARKQRADEMAAQRKANPPKPPPNRGPIPPRPDFVYVGFIGPKDAKIAAFTKGDEIQIARIGETIPDFGDKFIVKTIEHEEVLLAFVDPRFAEANPASLKRKPPRNR